MNAADLAARLDLRPLPGEGGLFRRTYADANSSAILYLLVSPDFSALHRLPGPELWHFHAGAPLRFLLLHPDGTATAPVLEAPGCPQVVVRGGVWQGAASTGSWSLVGTTMAPPYRDEDVELGDRDWLTSQYPAYAEAIRALTRKPR
ncbi:MAG: cupin domain-containing protein [Actinomycetota bacterium]|nr:cupin domain-containing protein [Actinomycetota bacterium]